MGVTRRLEPAKTAASIELYKLQQHRGQQPSMFHYRENRGPEVDLLIDQGDCLHAIEIKSGATAVSEFFKHFALLPDRLKNSGMSTLIRNHVIYGCEHSQQRSRGQLVPWNRLSSLL
jgi:predicted AAA+ superfamily ATPase